MLQTNYKFHEYNRFVLPKKLIWLQWMFAQLSWYEHNLIIIRQMWEWISTNIFQLNLQFSWNFISWTCRWSMIRWLPTLRGHHQTWYWLLIGLNMMQVSLMLDKNNGRVRSHYNMILTASTSQLPSENDIDGLVQESRNSSANALELHLSGTNPSICWVPFVSQWSDLHWRLRVVKTKIMTVISSLLTDDYCSVRHYHIDGLA